MCTFVRFPRSSDRARAAGRLIALAIGFMVTVRFRVRLGLRSRFKVRLPFAFVILRDRPCVCLCEDIPLQETVAFGGQDWRQRDETEVQRVEGICTSSADCSRCSSRRSQGEATCKFLLTSVRVAVVFGFLVMFPGFHSILPVIEWLSSDLT